MTIPGLPSPPTDNLYKFMALSGLVLIIIAPFFWANYYFPQADRIHLAFESLRDEVNGLSLPDPLKQTTQQIKEERAKMDALRKKAAQAGHDFVLYEDFRPYVIGVS